MRALSVIHGIAAYVVLRDIWGSSDKESESNARWIADALIDTTLREAAANGHVREANGRSRVQDILKNRPPLEPLKGVRKMCEGSVHLTLPLKPGPTMTDETMNLQTLLEKSFAAELLREMTGFAALRLMELEIEGLTSAAHRPIPAKWSGFKAGFATVIWPWERGQLSGANIASFDVDSGWRNSDTELRMSGLGRCC